MRVSSQIEGQENMVKVMKLEGGVVAPGQETAFVGKFLKSLKDNPVFSTTFSEIRLANMTQKRIMDREISDFSILCSFGQEKAS